MNRWWKVSTALVLGLSWSCTEGAGHHASSSAADRDAAADTEEPSIEDDEPDSGDEPAASSDMDVSADEGDSVAEADAETGQGPESDAPEALCKFEPCGGDLVGDWAVENICLGGVLGPCEVGYPDLGEGGMLHFGCAGDFHGSFGAKVSCVPKDCDCSTSKNTTPEDATYIAFGTAVTFRPAGGSPVDLDYCVRDDVLTIGQQLSLLTLLGPIRQYAAFTARRVSSSSEPLVCAGQ
jgi:hypothetical protein